MVLVKGTARYEFLTTGVELEGGKDTTKASQIVDVMFPWESAPCKQHARNLTVSDFLIDQFPVTIEDYDTYLKGSGYVPKDGHNWLKNWGWPHSSSSSSSSSSGAGAGAGAGVGRAGTGERRGGVPKVPQALARVPVTYVSFAEATAYCNAHGKRLPSTIEWQYAGQGTTDRMYPWGDADDPGCRPMLHDNRTLPGALPVETYASTGNCSSVFNVSDMIGAE
jgi:formylglycine-generating enzyme required for sulfatase activity